MAEGTDRETETIIKMTQTGGAKAVRAGRFQGIEGAGTSCERVVDEGGNHS